MEFGGLAKYTNIIFKTNNKKYNDEQKEIEKRKGYDTLKRRDDFVIIGIIERITEKDSRHFYNLKKYKGRGTW